MIKELKYYTIICDGCGEDLNEDCEFSCWDTVEYNEDCAREDNWEIIDEKHYCPNCLEWDEEEDKRIPKKNN